MAFTTNLQQVLAYLKAGHPLKPPGNVMPAGAALTVAAPPTTALPSMAQKPRQAPVMAPKVGP